jgi:predicted PurR-regulated permease PerM
VHRLQDKTLVAAVAAVTLIFAWVLWPFSGAILWAAILAVLFAPLQRSILASLPRWPSLAATTTLLIILLLVVLPVATLVNATIREAGGVYGDFREGRLSLDLDAQRLRETLPTWVVNLADRLGLPDAAALRQRITETVMQSGEFLAGQAFNLGQTTIGFVVSLFVTVYLLFFFLRDGDRISATIGRALPLRREQRAALSVSFTTAVRAIVKGSIVVALVQGTLGGLIFWFLDIRAPLVWGAVMMIFSMLPVVGTGLIWGPTAVWLIATGALWQGLVLIVFGVVVIGLVDNVLRPILIGQDTRIPDWVVLVSTLGGLVTFGANGFVIGPIIAAMFISLWSVFSADPDLDEPG